MTLYRTTDHDTGTAAKDLAMCAHDCQRPRLKCRKAYYFIEFGNNEDVLLIRCLEKVKVPSNDTINCTCSEKPAL